MLSIRKENKMADKEQDFLTEKNRTRKGSDTANISITIPDFLLKIIDEEASFKYKSRSQVIAYLVYSGLKAHVSEFRFPSENTINKNYIKRGHTWHIET